MRNVATEHLRRRYLLGELRAEESARLEEAYFSDDDEFERLLASEEELIDDYARGLLPPDQCRKLEAALQLRSRQADRVTFARALAEVTAGSKSKLLSPGGIWPSRLVRWRAAAVAAALAVVLAAIGGGFWYQVTRLKLQLAHLESQLGAERELQAETEAQLKLEKNESEWLARALKESRPNAEGSPPGGQGPKIASLMLRPVVLGEPAANVLSISSGTERVNLKLKTEVPCPAAEAVIADLDGKSIWQSGVLRNRQAGSDSTFNVEVPAPLFQGRAYIVRLIGRSAGGSFRDAGEYYLQVEHR